MRRIRFTKARGLGVWAAFLFLTAVCSGRMDVMRAEAEESGYSEMIGGEGESFMQDAADPDLSETFEEETEAAPGTYTMEEGWAEDEALSTEDVTVYIQDAYLDTDVSETSTISCSYLETNYSRQDYEQLRDMLTNNLLYSNVDAQITTSAVYTLSMDYLYIVLVDDSSEEYRDIYHYVVGDYQCFCVQVTEYRTEAELAEAQDLDTPREIGQKVAEGFVWN